MKYDKNYLRKVFLLRRKKKYKKKNKFNFNLLFKLIKRQFHNKKITIGGYYPSYYEADVTNFLKEAIKKKFKIALPVLQTSSLMCFRSWNTKEPLYINKFGMLEPENKKKEPKRYAIMLTNPMSWKNMFKKDPEIQTYL